MRLYRSPGGNIRNLPSVRLGWWANARLRMHLINPRHVNAERPANLVEASAWARMLAVEFVA